MRQSLLETAALSAMRDAIANGGDELAIKAAGRDAAEKNGIRAIAADTLVNRLFNRYIKVWAGI